MLDIAGQAFDVPAAQLFGGRQRQPVPMVWSLASGVVDQELEEALKVNQQYGFTLFKVKVGYAKPQVDLSRVEALVRDLPADFQVRIDANQGSNEVTAPGDIGITGAANPAMGS